MKLNIKNFSIAFGITWAAFVLSLGWTAALLGWGDQIVATMASLYSGYDATFLGGIVGALWGFVDGALFGAVSSYLYNRLAK